MRAISALNHPHTCKLYDAGPNYLVIEYIEGSTLAAAIKQASLDGSEDEDEAARDLNSPSEAVPKRIR